MPLRIGRLFVQSLELLDNCRIGDTQALAHDASQRVNRPVDVHQATCQRAMHRLDNAGTRDARYDTCKMPNVVLCLPCRSTSDQCISLSS